LPEHENEMCRVSFGELLAPLPFPSCVGRPRPERSDVRLVERANMELSERAQIGDGGFAQRQIADVHRRRENARRTPNDAADSMDQTAESHAKNTRGDIGARKRRHPLAQRAPNIDETLHNVPPTWTKHFSLGGR